MTQRTLQDFQDQVLPMLRQEAQGAGQLGSSMNDRAVGIAGGRLMDSLAAQNAGLYMQAGQAAQDDLRLGSQLGAGFTSQNAAAANAARANNQGAANQFRLSNAGYRNNAALANQQSANAARQYRASARNERNQFNANLGASQRAGDQNFFSSIYSPTMGQSTAALGMLPGLAQGQMLPGQVQQVIGQQQRANQQELNQQRLGMAQANRNQWMNDLGQWTGIVGPMAGFGGGVTHQSAPGGSTVAGVAGGALSGAAAGSMIGGPFGTAAGAILGGIAGGWG
jgi:hypothetical protein